MSNNSENSSIINENDISDWKTYRNEEYGFEIILLESWKGYKVFKESWNGTTLDGNSVKYEGPKIVIRNPKWSEYEIWQDVPVLVFTKDEWQLIEANNLGIFVAPIAPSKLGENNKYVFALPPRWIGFADALGQDEVQKTVETFKALTLDETSDWKTYDNSETNFTFKYPKNWEISEDYFYETVSGVKPERRTVNLKEIGENKLNNWILINQRQFLCDQSKCEIIAGNEIGTYSKNSEILIVFEQIISTFKLIEKEKQLYFGLNQNNKYSLVDLNSGKIRK